MITFGASWIKAGLNYSEEQFKHSYILSKSIARHPHDLDRLPENPKSILQNSGHSQVYPNGEK